MRRRGTGHMFSETALDEFLRRNGLSHVIRAHEVKAAGFQVNKHTGSSGYSHGWVGIKIEALFEFRLGILKWNFCFNVSRT